MLATQPQRSLIGVLAAAALLIAAGQVRADAFRPIRIRVGTRTLSLATPAIRAADEVYAPLALLDALGVKHRETPHEESVIVAAPDGRECEIGLARPGKHAMVPVSSLAAALGYAMRLTDRQCLLLQPGEAPPAESSAAAPKSAPSRSATAPERPARPNPAPPERPAAGAEATRSAQEKQHHPVPASPAAPTRAGATPPPSAGPIQHAEPVDEIAVAAAGSAATLASTDGMPLPISRMPEPEAAGTDRLLLPPNLEPARLQLLDFVASDAAHAQLRLYVSGAVAPTVTYAAMPSRLTIVLPNTAMEGVPACRIDHPFARGLSVSPGPSRGSLQVTLVLGRLVAYSLTETGPGVFSLNLRLPRGAGMRLEDAVVVIDPGHGGKQTGCQLNVGDTRLEEKALTLAIAKRVQAELRSLGIAHTFLTRADDSLVDLYERTRIAAAHNADLFVSIHVDEWARSTAACGPTAYYHRADESGRALAQSLIGHVGQASVTSSRGALSDGVLYANGLAVLRSATMPAALVECGFLTNPTDRKALVTDAYQAKLAKAIAEGIRGYLNASLPDPPTATANTE